MSEAKWTKGPWRVSGVSLNTGSITISQDEYKIVIADVHNAASFGDLVAAGMAGRRDFSENDWATVQHANAALIAAAPELYGFAELALDALRIAADLIASRFPEHISESACIELARREGTAALAKARGE